MPKQYSKKELWDVYEKLPEDLQEAIFSPDTAEHIRNVCKRSEVKEEKISAVASLVGQVLMGLLTPEEFKKRLKEDLELSEEQVKSIFREINRFIFMPVRETLSALYGVEVKPTKKPQGAEEAEEAKQSNQQKKSPEDKYREPIE